VTVTYETIRAWCAKFGPSYAAGLRRRRAGQADKWHVDEVQLKIKGQRHWLWRAVDKHGVVLDILVQFIRRRLAIPEGGVENTTSSVPSRRRRLSPLPWAQT